MILDKPKYEELIKYTPYDPKLISTGTFCLHKNLLCLIDNNPPATETSAGGLGRFPIMQQGPLINNDLRNISDGCCYGYSGETGDGSLISGPVISCSANGLSAIQIKASNDGTLLYFRVKDIVSGNWSKWRKVN